MADNPPAFPGCIERDAPLGGLQSFPGMDLRDWFAGQALANSAICRHEDVYPQKTAYAFADAMLAERSK